MVRTDAYEMNKKERISHASPNGTVYMTSMDYRRLCNIIQWRMVTYCNTVLPEPCGNTCWYTHMRQCIQSSQMDTIHWSLLHHNSYRDVNSNWKKVEYEEKKTFYFINVFESSRIFLIKWSGLERLHYSSWAVTDPEGMGQKGRGGVLSRKYFRGRNEDGKNIYIKLHSKNK